MQAPLPPWVAPAATATAAAIVRHSVCSQPILPACLPAAPRARPPARLLQYIGFALALVPFAGMLLVLSAERDERNVAGVRF